MSDPANYAIQREGSAPEVRVARFGAPSLFGDVFWGAEHAEAAIMEAEPGEWLDDVRAEGAVAMHLPAKTVGFYTKRLSPAEAAVAVRLMSPLWPGWTIRAGTRLTEITGVVGVDLYAEWIAEYRAGAAATRDLFLTTFLPSEMGTRYAARDEMFSFGGVVSVRRAGRTTDRLVDVDIEAALFFGPALLDVLPRAPTVEEAVPAVRTLRRRNRLGSLEDTFAREKLHALIDVDARRLLLSVPEGLDEAEHYVKAHTFDIAWPGWTVVVERGGLAAHFAATGRPLPSIFVYRSPGRRPSLSASIASVHELLFEAGPSRLSKKTRNALWKRALDGSGLGRYGKRGSGRP